MITPSANHISSIPSKKFFDRLNMKRDVYFGIPQDRNMNTYIETGSNNLDFLITIVFTHLEHMHVGSFTPSFIALLWKTCRKRNYYIMSNTFDMYTPHFFACISNPLALDDWSVLLSFGTILVNRVWIALCTFNVFRTVLETDPFFSRVVVGLDEPLVISKKL